MIMMRLIIILTILAGSQIASAQQFVKLADSIRRARGIPAIGYAVFSTDKILDAGVAGYRKYRSRDSVQLSDRFNIGTNTFGFTSWLAGKLVEAGKINWNTTFVSLFPEYKTKVLPEFRNIDLKTLLSNTGALPPYNSINEYLVVPTFPQDLKNQRKEFSGWVLQKPGLNPKRDRKMIESIAGYTIAASMLEKASGTSWEKLIEEYVSKPLDISIKYGWPIKISDKQPAGHWARYGSMSAELADTWVKVYPPAIPAADINISISDYVKFLQANLRGLRGGKTLLTKKTLDLIHFGMTDYSFGWDNGAIGVDRISSHTGQSFLFASYVELIPEKNLGVLVVCNYGESMGKAGVINLGRLLRDYFLIHNSHP